jgi:hypothetical protein
VRDRLEQIRNGNELDRPRAHAATALNACPRRRMAVARGTRSPMGQFGRLLLILGVVLLVVGGALLIAEKLGLGRLPGDIVVERKGFRLYAPIATSILVSIVLTALLNLVFRK